MKWVILLLNFLGDLLSQGLSSESPKNFIKNIIRDNLSFILLSSVAMICIAFWISLSVSLIFLNISLQYEQFGSVRLNAELVGATSMIILSLLVLTIIRIWGGSKLKKTQERQPTQSLFTEFLNRVIAEWPMDKSSTISPEEKKPQSHLQ